MTRSMLKQTTFDAPRPEIVAASLGVPSAQHLELYEVLLDQVGTDAWARFRFVATEIGKAAGAKTFADVESDFSYLCEYVALPYLLEHNLKVDVVAVSMMSRPLEFGISDSQVTQFVEAFRVSSGGCEWEGL